VSTVMMSWADSRASVSFIYFPNNLFVFELDYIRRLQPRLCIDLSQSKRESNELPSA